MQPIALSHRMYMLPSFHATSLPQSVAIDPRSSHVSIAFHAPQSVAIDPRYASRKSKEYVTAGEQGLVQLSSQVGRGGGGVGGGCS